MKGGRVPILSSLAALLILFASCGRGATGDAEAAAETPAPVPAPAPMPRRGVVAEQYAPFYTDGSGDPGAPKPEYSASLDFGQEVELAGDGGASFFSVGGDYLPLIAVRLALSGETKSGWLRASHYAGGAEAAVVVGESAALSDDRSPRSNRLAFLARATLVAVARGEGSGGYLPALLPRPDKAELYASAFIEESALSFRREDLGAAILMAKAGSSRGEAERKRLLEEAGREHKGNAFARDIAALLGRTERKAGEPATEELVANFAAGRDGVAILKAPEAGAGKAAILARYDEVRTSARSSERFEVRGAKAHWYRVVTPEVGWVFGADLDGAD